MADVISVLLIRATADSAVSAQLTANPAISMIADAKDGREALHKLAVSTPDIIVVDGAFTLAQGTEMVSRITRQQPGVPLIVIAQTADVEAVRQFMRAGAQDFVTLPDDPQELVIALKNVRQVAQDKLARSAVAAISERSTKVCRVVALISAKGGVGKTTVAVNTAAALARQGKRVLFLDFDLQFGDASLFLNLEAGRTIVDLVRESDEIDADVIERYLCTHACGLFVLQTGRRPEEAEYIQPNDIRRVLQAARKRFDYVVVDTSPLANDVFFSIFEAVDERLMVSTLNLAVLKNNRMLLELLAELKYDRASVKHILNRVNSKNGLKVRDVNRILEAEVFWELDNDYQFVETSINEGMPFVLSNQQHRLSKQVFGLSARVEASQGNRPSRRNPLRKLLGSTKKGRSSESATRP